MFPHRYFLFIQESHVGNDVRFVNTMLLDFIRVREAETTDFKSGERVCRACKGDQVAIAVVNTFKFFPNSIV